MSEKLYEKLLACESEKEKVSFKNDMQQSHIEMKNKLVSSNLLLQCS